MAANTKSKSQLKNHLSILGGTILILNIILGSGLLILPGLVYKDVGDAAIFSWVAVGLVTLPILLVIVQLGKHYPSAGGVPHYAKMAFGKYMQLSASLLFLGAVSLGLPSISLTGGYYMSEMIGGMITPHAYAIFVISVSALLAILNIERLKNVINSIGGGVITIIVLYLAISCISLYTGNYESTINDKNIDIDIGLIFTPFMMIFFSFTGWEIASHLTEEFENPKRDYPIAMIFSFFFVSVLYLMSAWLVQKLDIQSSHETALTSVAKQLLGDKSSYFVPFFAFALVVANIFGATWAVSRLVYYLSIENYLPRYFSKTKEGVPVRSVLLTSIVLLSVVFANYLELLQIEQMFALAGQNFFLIYGIASAALFVLRKDLYSRSISILVIISIIVIVAYNNVSVQYPLSIFSISAIIYLAFFRTKKLSLIK